MKVKVLCTNCGREYATEDYEDDPICPECEEDLDEEYICRDCGSDELDDDEEYCPKCQGARDDMAYDMYRDLESDCGYPEKFKN